MVNVYISCPVDAVLLNEFGLIKVRRLLFFVAAIIKKGAQVAAIPETDLERPAFLFALGLTSPAAAA